jgi:hypothetical protein
MFPTKVLDLNVTYIYVALGGLVVAYLPLDPRSTGSKSDEGNGLFKNDKDSQHNFLQRGSKAISPML